jgi:hypothetical protein
MTQLKRQIIAVLAAGSTALSALAPMATAAELTITGNGSSSDNDIKIEQSKDTTVVQSNTAVVTNSVSSSAKTGGNRANDNTGGDVMIKTGDASTETTISNELNTNVAHVDCCEEGDLDVLISGNGSYSENEVEVGDGGHHRRSGDEIQIFQDNVAVVTNAVDTDAKTGGNDAKRNTGGDVTVRTGDASATVDVSTTANANVATVGGEGDENGEVSARIVGNGSNSDNDIDLEFDRDITIVQDNLAEVLKAVYADANTGWNDANYNTGGEVVILTGDADAEVVIDNLVNFNSADIDCGCLLDLEAKIAENGYDSENEIEAKFDGDQEVFQGGEEGDGNVALLTNAADADAKTGKNEADYNTGEAGDDPFIWTGDAWSGTEVWNTGNVNVYGGHTWDWPEFEWDWSFAHMFAH